MNINWYPGHMKKTFDALEKDIKKIDIVLYVLDSRAWKSSFNPKIDNLVKNKEILFVINKSDLIDEKSIKASLAYFKERNQNAIAIQGTNVSCKKIILSKLNEMLKNKFDNFKTKGINPVFKIMVVGTPNTGKSTIINSLNGEKKAKTGDKAGVTKTNQWVKVSDNYVVLDTPGTLWPKFDDDNDQKLLKLAFIGAIKKDVIDQTELGFELFKFVLNKNSSILKERYKLTDIFKEPIENYDIALKNCGCIKKGNEVDYERGGIKILEDFRSGRMGKICLD